MNKEPFPGFLIKERLVPLPETFFTALLSEISSLTELKLVLHVFRLLSLKKTQPKFVTGEELLADTLVMKGVDGRGSPSENLYKTLESAVDLGILLHLAMDREGRREDFYFMNTEPNRRVVADLQGGKISLENSLTARPPVEEDRPNIFDLYEQNIGLLTPMIADELRDAEKNYPASWIEEAFKEAVDLNKRSWRYISRILENWASEGKGSGEFRRHSKEKKDPNRYLKGKYGHVVRR